MGIPTDKELHDDEWVPVADCNKDKGESREIAETEQVFGKSFQGSTGWEYRAVKHEDNNIRIHSCSVFNDVIGTVDSEPVNFNNIDNVETWINEINWAYKALTKPVLNMEGKEI